MVDVRQENVFRRGWILIKRSLVAYPWHHGFALFGASLFSVAAVALTAALGRSTDDVIVPAFTDEGVTGRQVWAIVAVIIGVGSLRAIGVMLRRYFLFYAESATQVQWRRSLLDRYVNVPLSFHASRPAGQLLAHADADVDASTMVLKPIAAALGTVVLAAVSLVSLLFIHPLLALVAVVLFPVLAAVNRAYTRKVELPFARVQARIGDVSSIAHESFDGALMVKTLGREQAEIDRLAAAADALRKERIGVGRTRAAFEPAINALPNIGILALLAIGAWLVSRDSVTIGDLVQAMSLFTILALPVRIVGFFLQELPRSVAALDRIDEVIAAAAAIEPEGTTPLPGGPLGVSFGDVRFGYDEQTVLNQLDLDIQPGETVAIVGSTGSGKSTIAQLMAGLYPPADGHVRVGGIALADLPLAARRAAIGLVFQESYLFADSIERNIVLDLDISNDEVAWAVELAQAQEFLAEMPQGLKTVVGERGVTLSGGQRQRVALARALVRRPRLLLLDDATSAVDPRIERQILDGLRSELDVTLVLVAYRLATIQLADRVIYVDDGAVVATGSHDQLLALPAYEALVRAYEQETVL